MFGNKQLCLVTPDEGEINPVKQCCSQLFTPVVSKPLLNTFWGECSREAQ